MTPIKVEYRNVEDLRPFSGNPRLHSERQIKQLILSIKTYGFVVPVLVKDDELVAGHGRLLAALKAGITAVPTIRLDHLTEEQVKAYRIADNRLTDLSQWSDPILAQALKELSNLNLDFNLEATGFTMGEIDLRIEGLETLVGPIDPADTAPEPLTGPPISRQGDVWLLDRHRIACGSALDPATYAALLQHEVAAMVFSDPPYNVRIDGHATGLGRIHHREFAQAVGEMSELEYTQFLRTAIELMALHSSDGSLHFLCIDWRHLSEMLTAGKVIYTELKNLCVWVKDNAGMGSLYRSRHELVLVFKNGRGSHRNNVELGRFGRSRSNVWEYPGILTERRRSDEGDLLAMHPTVKPVRLVADAMLDCTARGDLVLDPFLGSGTTVVAAERTGRRCYGIEIDPLYVDTIVRRWQAYTGGQAVHVKSGRTFNQVADEQGQSHAEAAK